eukprot:TRINITY_DN5795_c0_g1_i2.p1 TRINITY_DN5795_c0_g1~~TRINITY_DN5795_c0_g1_i2.p1  ORF type:complete len:400 (+),score=38.31 TRINITY_DN5795_c0_g1_i2:1064-2263(+)
MLIALTNLKQIILQLGRQEQKSVNKIFLEIQTCQDQANIPHIQPQQINQNHHNIPLESDSKKVMASSLQTPGVGSYNPIKTTEIWSKFSFSYKPEPEVIPKTVGPADYKPNIKSTIRHVPSCQFGTSKRDSRPPALNPSPDQYLPNSTLIRSPQFSFAKTVRSGSMNLNTPGPGSYEHKSTLSQKMITMISRRNNSLKISKEKTPAPDSYNPLNYQQFCGVPSSIIGNAERTAFRRYEDNPGPGEYETTDINKPDIRQIKFPKSKRVPLQKAGVDTPGPGNYENKSYTKEGPTHIIAKKCYQDFSEKFPGPAHYEPQYKKLQRRNEEQQIGTSQRPELHLNTETPGPGNYHLLKNPEGIKYSIGNALRQNENLTDYPGPGEYDIPVLLANVPLLSLIHI